MLSVFLVVTTKCTSGTETSFSWPTSGNLWVDVHRLIVGGVGLLRSLGGPREIGAHIWSPGERKYEMGGLY